MCGYRLGEYLNKWELGGHLTDDEIQELYDGLLIVTNFMMQTGCRQMYSYYIGQLNSIRSAIEARKQDKTANELVIKYKQLNCLLDGHKHQVHLWKHACSINDDATSKVYFERELKRSEREVIRIERMIANLDKKTFSA